jgi:hypothetical protein
MDFLDDEAQEDLRSNISSSTSTRAASEDFENIIDSRSENGSLSSSDLDAIESAGFQPEEYRRVAASSSSSGKKWVKRTIETFNNDSISSSSDEETDLRHRKTPRSPHLNESLRTPSPDCQYPPNSVSRSPREITHRIAIDYRDWSAPPTQVQGNSITHNSVTHKDEDVLFLYQGKPQTQNGAVSGPVKMETGTQTILCGNFYTITGATTAVIGTLTLPSLIPTQYLETTYPSDLL